MSVHRQPENTNKSHAARPSLGKALKPMTDTEWHRWMKKRFPQVKPIGMEPCLFVRSTK